eukprot:COSAG04_NODE_9929_length_819_cov_1.175000_2_plen_178_part_00
MRAGYERHAERPGLRLRMRSDGETGAASGLVSDHVPVFGHGFGPHHAGKVPDDLLGEPISPPSPTQFDSSLRKTLTLSDRYRTALGGVRSRSGCGSSSPSAASSRRSRSPSSASGSNRSTRTAARCRWGTRTRASRGVNRRAIASCSSRRPRFDRAGWLLVSGNLEAQETTKPLCIA